MEVSIVQMQQLGATIRERRRALKVTQISLAEMCDVAPNTIIKMERGTGNARLQTLLRVTDVLGLSLELATKRLS